MTVKEIVIEYLKTNGFDGLCGDECGCEIVDLEPCGQIRLDCEAAYKYKCVNCGKCDCGLGDDCFSVEPPEGDAEDADETEGAVKP